MHLFRSALRDQFNSNWQPSTRSRDVKDGKEESVSREPEVVRAFRDTWKDGIYSYLSYLRDRLTVARDLLSETGSVFVQIGDENVHRVRALLDEMFRDSEFCFVHSRKEDKWCNQLICFQQPSTTLFFMLER